MNRLYITLFSNIVTSTVQTFIKSWKQFPYPRVCHLPFGHQRRKMGYHSFVVNISPSFREFTASLRHILPIHNVTINSNNMFVNFRWTFTFCVEKSYEGKNLAIGATLDPHCHFKKISLKQSRFYHCQTSTAHR